MDAVDKGVHFIQDKTKTLFEIIEKQVLEIGDKCEKFMDNTSANKKYMCEVLLRVPLFFIIHQWLLLSPYSNYWIIELFLFAVRYGVALLLVGTWAFNTGVLLQAYTILTVDLIILWLKKIDYWTNQDEAFDYCHEKNVFVWSDITERWIIPMTCSILLQFIYLSCRIGAFVHRGKERILTMIHVALVATLVPNILSAFGVYTSFMSELAYWVESILMAIIVVFEITSSLDIDINVDRKKLMMLILKLQLTYDDHTRLTYTTRIDELKLRIEKRSQGSNYADRFPGKWFLRDTMLAVGVVYLLLTFIAELTLFKRPVYTMLTVDTILEVSSAWCTTHVIVIVMSYGIGFLSNIMVALSHLFLTAEINILEAIDANIGGIVQVSALITCAEADILSLEYIEKLEAMKIVIFFSFYVIVFQTLDVLEKKILHAVNSGSSPGFLFYVRIVILSGLLVTAPSLSTIVVSKHLNVSPWLLFFASGNCTLILRTLTLLLECSLVSCTWHITNHLDTLEDLIYYTRTSKSIGLIILNGFQSYCRYICPLFKGWWFMRLCLALFSFAAVAGLLGTVEYSRYKGRYKMKTLLENLQDVKLETTESGADEKKDPEECAICYSVIIEGKVLPCKHIFHKDCLRRWFQVKAVCPFCNSEIK